MVNPHQEVMMKVNEIVKKDPNDLTDEDREVLRDHAAFCYRVDQGILNRNRDRIAALEEYSVSALIRINETKRLAYKYGLDII